MRHLPLIVLTAAFLSSCTPSETKKVETGKTDSLNQVTVIDNIPYREGASKSWQLDLAMPQNFGDAPRPAIVIVHGGGWRFGSKQDGVYRRFLLDYAFQGYVTVSVDYRLLDEAPVPACIEDAKCAVRWLRAHAKEYNVDPNRIGAYGHSAGGHLVLMLGMTTPSAGLEGDGGWNEFSSIPNVVISGAGPPAPSERQADWNKTQWWPVGYMSANIPPTLLIHGDADEAVAVGPVDDFYDKMKTLGAPVEYVRIEGGDHGVAYEKKLEITKPAMDNFFKKHLKK